MSYRRALQFNDLRILILAYLHGYIFGHWCRKGHIVHGPEGEFLSELDTGEKSKLTPDMTYIASGEVSPHRSSTEKGVQLLTIYADYFKYIP